MNGTCALFHACEAVSAANAGIICPLKRKSALTDDHKNLLEAFLRGQLRTETYAPSALGHCNLFMQTIELPL